MTFAAVRCVVAVRTCAEMAARPKRHTNPKGPRLETQRPSRAFTMHISSAADQNGPEARRQGPTTEAYAVVRRGEERRANDADGSCSSAASEDDRLAIDAEHLTVHVGNLAEAHIVLHRVDEDRHHVPAVAAGVGQLLEPALDLGGITRRLEA